jgi:hypothetical protein
MAGGSASALSLSRPAQASLTLPPAGSLSRKGSVTTALGRAVLQCYYRDDRVMRSLGIEPRSPYPKGRVLEQGDWSLLNRVRDRPRMWRDVDSSGT